MSSVTVGTDWSHQQMVTIHIGIRYLSDKGVLGEHHRQRANHGDAAVMRLNGRAVRIRQKVLTQPGIELIHLGNLFGIFPGFFRECTVVTHQGAKRRPLRPAHIGFRITAGKAVVPAGIDAPERQARGRDGKHAGQRLPHTRKCSRLISTKLAGVGLASRRTGPLKQNMILSVGTLKEFTISACVVQRVTIVHFLTISPIKKGCFIRNFVPEVDHSATNVGFESVFPLRL